MSDKDCDEEVEDGWILRKEESEAWVMKTVIRRWMMNGQLEGSRVRHE